MRAAPASASLSVGSTSLPSTYIHSAARCGRMSAHEPETCGSLAATARSSPASASLRRGAINSRSWSRLELAVSENVLLIEHGGDVAEQLAPERAGRSSALGEEDGLAQQMRSQQMRSNKPVAAPSPRSSTPWRGRLPQCRSGRQATTAASPPYHSSEL